MRTKKLADMLRKESGRAAVKTADLPKETREAIAQAEPPQEAAQYDSELADRLRAQERERKARQRAADPESYKAYMREYMKERRKGFKRRADATL